MGRSDLPVPGFEDDDSPTADEGREDFTQRYEDLCVVDSPEWSLGYPLGGGAEFEGRKGVVDWETHPGKSVIAGRGSVVVRVAAPGRGFDSGGHNRAANVAASP